MFSLLREQGVAARLDENIGMDFINMKRTSHALDTKMKGLPNESPYSIEFNTQLETPTDATYQDEEEE